MAQRSRFWDGTTVGDATVAPYDAGTEFAEVMTAVAGLADSPNKGGIISGLAASVLVGNTVRVTAGEALVYGTWYQSDANTDLTIATPASATRIDRIVLRKSWSAQTVRMAVITGSEGGAAPALTQTVGTTWEITLWQVSITTAGAITFIDQRESLDGFRDTAWWGPVGTGALDTFIRRTSAGVLTVGNNVAAGAGLYLNSGASGQGANIVWENQGSYRWNLATLGDNSSSPLILYDHGVAGATFTQRISIQHTGTFNLQTDANVRGIVVGDPTGGGDAAQQRYVSMNFFSKSGTLGADTCIEFCAPNPNKMGIDFHVPNVAKWGGLYMNGAGNVYLGLDIGWGLPQIYMQGIFNFGFGRLYSSPSGQTPFIDGQTGGFLLLGGGHSGGNAISVAPATHNATHLGWGDRGWALVHSVGGVVLDSRVEAKQNFARLDQSECVEAVLNTDWVAFEYRPPANPEPLSRPESMPDDEWTAFLAQNARMQEEDALSRKQRGYVLGSDEYRVHNLFGMADRKSAGTQSDLATVACALQAALKQIADQQIQLDALKGKVN